MLIMADQILQEEKISELEDIAIETIKMNHRAKILEKMNRVLASCGPVLNSIIYM